MSHANIRNRCSLLRTGKSHKIGRPPSQLGQRHRFDPLTRAARFPSAGFPGQDTEQAAVPRYLIERDFPDGVSIPRDEAGASLYRRVIDNNAEDGVTWLQSYVTPDRKRTFCIYDAPTPEAVRRAAARNKLPVSKITEVRVLDPYFYD